MVKTLFRALLGKRLPVTEGSIEVEGLRARVRIRRDSFGVPYIVADDDADAWYALGFCHGQDRTFQLESLVRVIRGTLAELIGEEGLAVDRLSRRLGLKARSIEQLEMLAPEIREMLEAYALGATAGSRAGVRRPPHEFTLLRAEPSRYEASDAVGMLKLMSFLLASNWDRELARYQVLTLDGPEALEAVDVTYPEWHGVTLPPHPQAGSVAAQLAEEVARFRRMVGAGGGSNNWAISASKTATGRPLLANDPHLAATLPPHWYLVHIRTPRWSVAGASFVGIPGVPVGHNGYCAWGVTAGLVDNTDLFLEEVGPDGASVRDGDGFVTCRVRREEITVKGGETVVEEVLETPRGPLIGPALDGVPVGLSIRATWLESSPFRGLLAVHEAGSWEEFRALFDPWPGLPLNMIYADRDGRIGWQLVGDAPVRSAGLGAVPSVGWEDSDWTDAKVPFEAMPHAVDPPEGYLATANNRPVPVGAEPFLGVDWIEGYRYARITEVLAERDDWTVDACLRLQTDVESIPWREMRPFVLQTETGDPDGLRLLESWDGVVGAESAGAAMYEVFVSELIVDLVRSRAPQSAEWALGRGFDPLVPETAFAFLRTGWLVDMFQRGRVESSRVEAALGRAVNLLRRRLGPDPALWAWGRLRPLTLSHPVGQRRPLDRVFNLGPFPWGGDATTVGQAAVVHRDLATPPPFIASLRVVIDVGNWSASRYVLPGGQSGNPMSPHYADQLELWKAGSGIPIAWEEDEIETRIRSVLELRPNLGGETQSPDQGEGTPHGEEHPHRP